MPVIIEPAIEVGDIKVQMDSESSEEAEKIMREWGHSIPMIKINDYVLEIGECTSLTVSISLGNLPTFNLTLDDEKFKIRKALKKEIDTCIINIGFKNFRIKFNGIITSNNSYDDDPQLNLSGNLYQKEIYTREQRLWKDKPIVDILKDICSDTKFGLFIFDNDYLNYVPDVVINPNTRNISFIDTLLKRYTNNLYCFDTFGYLHVGNYKEIIKKEIDEYIIYPYTGDVLEESKPIIFVANKRRREENEDDEKEKYKIHVESIAISSNFSSTIMSTDSKYSLNSDKQKIELESDEEVGFGELAENTFYGFENHKFPHYYERINKEISGCRIELVLRNLVPEIVPFTVVELENWIEGSQDNEKNYHLDTEHSGKHFVIGYSYIYNKQDDIEDRTNNYITQKIHLI